MNIQLTEDILQDMKETIQFMSDGCACGDFIYQLENGVWLTVNQSCRKSSMTPDEKLWHLHDVTFYESIRFDRNEVGNSVYVEIEEFGEALDHYIIEEESKQKLYRILKKKAKEMWGDEYRDGDLDDEDKVDNFVDELNNLLKKYNFELFHYDEIDVRETLSDNRYQAKATIYYNDKTNEIDISKTWDEAPIRTKEGQ